VIDGLEDAFVRQQDAHFLQLELRRIQMVERCGNFDAELGRVENVAIQ
jgi:hypothetical protein